MPNVLNPRGIVSRPDNMDETVLHMCVPVRVFSVPQKGEIFPVISSNVP